MPTPLLTRSMADWARAYIRIGFALCLIRPRSKVPMLAAWNDPHRVIDTEEKAAAALLANSRCGIGVVHANSRVAVLDVDHVGFTRLAFEEFGFDYDDLMSRYPRIRTREGKDKILFRLPEGFFPGTHSIASKTILRWPNPESPGQNLTVFELRGGLNQDVLPPSIHPDTQRPYEWVDNQTPWDFDPIPEIDVRLLTIWKEWDRFGAQLLFSCPWGAKQTLCDTHSAPVLRVSTPKQQGLIERFNEDHDIAAMLVEAGYKQHGKRWMAPSSKTKIPGVVLLDGKVYSHHASDVLANGHANDAFDVFTLLEHGGDLSRAIKAAGKMYRSFGAEPRRETDLSGILRQLGDTGEDQRRRLRDLAAQPQIERVETAGLRCTPFPISGLEAFARWFDDCSDETHPLVSQAAVLSVISVAAGRRYVSQFGDCTGLYLGILSPAGAQARYAGIGCNRVLMVAGLRSMVRATRLSSPQQLYALLGSRPAALYLADDYGDQVRIARRQPSGLLEQTLSLITGTVASGADLLLDNWQELGMRHQEGDGSSYPTICSPVLSMLGTISGGQCGKVFGAQEVSRGSIDSFLFVPATDVEHWRARARAFSPVEPPDEVVDRLRTLRGFAADATTQTAQQIFEDNGWLQPTAITVRFTGDVQRVEAAWLSQYQRQSPTIRALASAARSRLRRICTAMAAFANPQAPVADQAIVSWAAGWVGYCLEQTIIEADLRATPDDDKPDAYQQVLEFIGTAGASGASKRTLYTYCWMFRSMSTEKRDALIDQMLQDEAIQIIPTLSGRGKVMVHARFLKRNEEAQRGAENADLCTSSPTNQGENGSAEVQMANPPTYRE